MLLRSGWCALPLCIALTRVSPKFALMFNRKLWCIFFAQAESNENPNPKEVRQGIVNIATFVFAQTT